MMNQVQDIEPTETEMNQPEGSAQPSAVTWESLNTAYKVRDQQGDFQADLYWPTKERKLPEGDLNVEIVGLRFLTSSTPPRLHIYLHVPSTNQKAIKSYRLLPDAMTYLRADMERLGILVDDIRKLGEELKKLAKKPVHARLYYNPKTSWQDLEFVSPTPVGSTPHNVPAIQNADELTFDF